MKNEIRENARIKRRAISVQKSQEKSQAIKKNMFSTTVFQNAKTVLFYVSKGSEVDTHAMIKESLGNSPSNCIGIKRVVVPVTDMNAGELLLSEIHGLDELKPGSFGVPEPEIISKVEPSEIDLVIVPGLAFDSSGGRIGYGKGFYDRFLKNINAKKIALAYNFQVIESVPSDPHDVKVDKIITEQGIVECN